MAAVASSHLAALHRGLLVVLTIAVLTLLPAIVCSGTSGPAWMERQAEPPAGSLSDFINSSDDAPVAGTSIDVWRRRVAEP